MTGFGAAEGPVGGGRVRIEIRTVNHRHFNPSLKLPTEFAALEADIRERLRREFDRGHVAVSLRWTEPPAARTPGLSVDLERARAVTAAL
ncbi:MAG TPA: YicC/YloC family endoribonuclease, partial [Gemmatimonadales bacterium]|nr:YicC/YloC family endoribonuclease [Gemmatimonadales bacterium]